MNKPSKCKNCQWYGKPYWSIINPCDNCSDEEINVEILSRWQEPTIEKQQKEIEHLQNLIGKATNYYLKTLAKNGSMPDEAVEMFNLLEGNK